MTVQKDVTKNIYVGNGSTRTFPFTFECPAEHPEYIKVYLMQDDGTALATSDYQLDMDARQITYPSSGTALPEGKKLVIMRELPLQQMMNLVNNGPYFAEDVELAFDENVMAMQQIAEKLNRSIIMSVDIDGDAFVNEVPFEAGKSFRIADDGKSIVLTEDPARVLPTVQNLATAAETSAKQARFNAESAANHVIAAERESRNAEKYAEKAKDISENVNVFVPAVDAGGTLTWTNKAGLANPAAVNIKGPQGVQGKKGDPGTGITIKGKYDSLSALQAAHPKADEGDAYMAGTNLYVWNGSAWIDCGNVQGPKGDKGDTGSKGDAFTYADFTQEQLASLKGPKGDTGPRGEQGERGPQGLQGATGATGAVGTAATIKVGTVSTGNAGSAVSITNSGTASEVILNFVIPKGDKGDQGQQGEQGLQGIQGPQGIQGATGAAGTTATIKVGTVTTGAAGTSAKVVNSGTTSAAVLDFTIPQGAKGDKGEQGSGATGNYLPLTGGTVTGGITASNFQTGSAAGNYFQCRRFRGEGDANSYYHAIDFGYSGHDSVDFYEYDPNWNFYKCLTGTKSGAVLVGNINGNGWNGGARLSGAPTAPTAATGTNNTQIATTAFVQSAIPTNVSSFTNDAGYLTQHQSLDGYVKSVNNTKPDSNGNVTITIPVSPGSPSDSSVSLSAQNTWTAQQTFEVALLELEKYTTAYDSGTSITLTKSTARYIATGNFTLDLTTMSYLISNGQSQIITVYIQSSADYSLTIKGAGTLKYIGAASNLAITSAGLLLNILMMSDGNNGITSIVQASKLA